MTYKAGSTEDKRCDNCAASHDHIDIQSGQRILQCRLNPPLTSFVPVRGPDGGTGVQMLSVFPAVNPADWCNNFRHKQGTTLNA